MSFTLSVTPAPSAPLDVDVHVTDRGDFVLAANEGVQTVTVPAGAATHAFTVATDNDTEDEVNDAVFVAVLSATDYTTSVNFAGTVRVTDNDATVVSLVATSDVTFTEETPTDTAAVTVRLPRRLYAGENLAVPIEFLAASGASLHTEANQSYTPSVSGTGVTSPNLTGGSVYVRFTGHDTNIVQEATVTVTPTSNDDGNTAAGSLTIELSPLSSGDWPQSFTTVGGGGAPHGTDYEVELVYADNDVMFDTLTLLDLGGPRIHLDIGTSPGVTGSGRDWTLEEGTDIVLRFSNLTRTLHSQDLTVNYAVAGAKFHVPDGHRGTRTVTIPANTRSVQVTLPTEATTDDETDAELSVMLLAATPHVGDQHPGDLHDQLRAAELHGHGRIGRAHEQNPSARHGRDVVREPLQRPGRAGQGGPADRGGRSPVRRPVGPGGAGAVHGLAEGRGDRRDRLRRLRRGGAGAGAHGPVRARGELADSPRADGGRRRGRV